MFKEEYSACFKKISPPEELEKETLEKLSSASGAPRKKLRKKAIVIAAVSAAAALTAGGAVYASYPTAVEYVDEDGRTFVFAEAIPQEPVKGFARARIIGEKLNMENCPVYGEPTEYDFTEHLKFGVYAVPAIITDNGGYVEKIAYSNGEVIIISGADGGGFALSAGQTAEIRIDADLSAPYASDSDGDYIEAGYILDGKAYEIFGDKIYGGKLKYKQPRISFTADEDGGYLFYVMNFSAGMQNYRSIEINIE